MCREYAAVLKTYRLATVTGDFYGGTWPGERFAAHGVSYHLSARSKSEIYLATLPIFNAGGGTVDLLDSPRLVSQLAALERRVGRGGRESVDHPPGRFSRDDLANAACGALLLAHEQQSVCVDFSAVNAGFFKVSAWREAAG